MLAALLARSTGVSHHVLVLGHCAVRQQAVAAGIGAERITCGHTMGWADPSGWRAVRQAVERWKPSIIHVWSGGLRGAVAATVLSSYHGARLLTVASPLSAGQMRLLRIVTQRAEWVVAAVSSSLERGLLAGGLAPGRMVRIRPGIALAQAAGEAKTPLRKRLGIRESEGPVILVGGPAVPAARQDHALWAAGILGQLYPQTKVILPTPVDKGEAAKLDRAREFAGVLQDRSMVVYAPPEMRWATLVQAADIFLITPEAPIATGSILWAQAAGVPVLGTAVECVSELVEHAETGLLALPGQPRMMASRLEEFMSDSTLRWPLTDKARASLYGHFQIPHMLESFRSVYQQMLADPSLGQAITVPPAPETAADRFAGVVKMT